ncbi:hypothetical protein [Chromobacterium sp. IIBBL 290-4]|uniref:hypothetical protein n=1 Tax=Chromobacterium sp. IIBBL 290-4 TaxID=2953890 RepID=UPI0020B6F244|nr:hypothetical protein [Chromobacterium sp. IIBBL 290-4]UTH74158.1 hypothetical protein NKT35_21880 [Chromobacterium sp. IIBBL 290-4]
MKKILSILFHTLFEINYGSRFKVDSVRYAPEENNYIINYIQTGKRVALAQTALEIYRNDFLMNGFSKKDCAEIGRFAGESIEKQRMSRYGKPTIS